jgi:hypothetical protein
MHRFLYKHALVLLLIAHQSLWGVHYTLINKTPVAITVTFLAPEEPSLAAVVSVPPSVTVKAGSTQTQALAASRCVSSLLIDTNSLQIPLYNAGAFDQPAWQKLCTHEQTFLGAVPVGPATFKLGFMYCSPTNKEQGATRTLCTASPLCGKDITITFGYYTSDARSTVWQQASQLATQDNQHDMILAVLGDLPVAITPSGEAVPTA